MCTHFANSNMVKTPYITSNFNSWHCLQTVKIRALIYKRPGKNSANIVL